MHSAANIDSIKLICLRNCTWSETKTITHDLHYTIAIKIQRVIQVPVDPMLKHVPHVERSIRSTASTYAHLMFASDAAYLHPRAQTVVTLQITFYTYT